MNTSAPKTSPDAALGNLMAAALEVPAPAEAPEVPAWATGGLQESAPPLTAAARDVLAERQRQISVEGWTPEHDDRHTTGALATAAGCYAMFTLAYPPGDPVSFWPWSPSWWKPSEESRRNLVKAGALILAEIERLDRAIIAARRGDQSSSGT